MTEEFFVFQKFTDIEIANQFAQELKINGIPYLLQNNNKSSVGNFEINTIDFDVAINIKSADFTKASKVLEDYYIKEVDNVDKDYYLFQFTDDELHDIISKPYEWGQFDYQLAKKLLKDRGIEISDDTVSQIKNKTIIELSKIEEVSKFKIISGYILSIIFPLAGLIIGNNIFNNRKILPNGQVFYLHSEDDRKHGKQILTLSITWLVILIVINISLIK